MNLCAYKGCEEPATQKACGRNKKHFSDKTNTGHPKPAEYCQKHANIVANENSPEYIEQCPNCGCTFGVN